MSRGASVFLAIGLALAGGLYGGIWEYGDGFIFNRFNGDVIYVDLPDTEDAVGFDMNRSGRASRLESARASLRADSWRSRWGHFRELSAAWWSAFDRSHSNRTQNLTASGRSERLGRNKFSSTTNGKHPA